jgi:ribosome-associated protein
MTRVRRERRAERAEQPEPGAPGALSERSTDDAIRLAHAAIEVLDERKGEDLLLLDLRGAEAFTDAFVICTGGSERTLRALAEEVERRLDENQGRRPLHVEGDAGSGWVLLDYGPVIVHLFSPRLRSYYRLEELWKQGRVLLRIS